MIPKASPQPKPFCNPVVLTHLGSGGQLPPGKHVAVQASSKGIISLSSSWKPGRHSRVTVSLIWYQVLPPKGLFTLP